MDWTGCSCTSAGQSVTFWAVTENRVILEVVFLLGMIIYGVYSVLCLKLERCFVMLAFHEGSISRKLLKV